MKTKSIATAILFATICVGTVIAREHYDDRSRLVQIHDEMILLENLIIRASNESNSYPIDDVNSQSGISFNYQRLLDDVQETRQGISAHIDRLNTAPKWHRFRLQ